MGKEHGKSIHVQPAGAVTSKQNSILHAVIAALIPAGRFLSFSFITITVEGLEMLR